MKLIDEWKIVLTNAWSMRLGAVLLLLGVLYAAVPGFGALLAPGTMGVAVLALAVALGVARLINQGDTSTWVAEWRHVLTTAWSMRTTYLLAILGAAQTALPYFGDAIAPRAMGSATAILALVIGTLRILDQGNDALTNSDAGFTAAPQAAAPPGPAPVAPAAAPVGPSPAAESPPQ